MKVSELGEFELINLVAGMTGGSYESDSRLVIGIGDDAAAWQGDGLVQLATTDSLVQDVHFSLEIADWGDLGWRALAANLSDIAAMGGLPRYALVSLSLPGQTEVDDVVLFYRGMLDLAGQYGVAIIGGDMSGAPVTVINITLLGSAASNDGKILTRSAARPGDKVAVTGFLGSSAAGLEMLRRKLDFEADDSAVLRQAFLRPEPRVLEGQILVEQGVAAAIDVSDGLLADLGHICEMSGVSAIVNVDSLPIHLAVKINFQGEAMRMALSGGEDYELLFTAPDNVIEKVKAVMSCPVTIIGEITGEKTGGVVAVDGDGNRVEVSGTGWAHFTRG